MQRSEIYNFLSMNFMQMINGIVMVILIIASIDQVVAIDH